MNFDFLSDLKITDLSGRLPGPYATFVLKSLGAVVNKIENLEVECDPFISKDYKKLNPNFSCWYENMNKDKAIHQFSFSEEPEKLQKFLENGQIIISPRNRFFEKIFENYELKSSQTLIYINGGKNEWKHLHDLNALAFTKTFSDHLAFSDTPPFLPLAGMSYGQFIATAALASLRKAERSNLPIETDLYLSEVIPHLYDALHSKQSVSPHKFLHNGAYPSYNIYKTKDAEYVCLAAVEEKYWQRFCELFSCEDLLQDAFDSSGKTHDKLRNLFSKLTYHEINETLNNESICLTLVTAEKE